MIDGLMFGQTPFCQPDGPGKKIRVRQKVPYPVVYRVCTRLRRLLPRGHSRCCHEVKCTGRCSKPFEWQRPTTKEELPVNIRTIFSRSLLVLAAVALTGCGTIGTLGKLEDGAGAEASKM